MVNAGGAVCARALSATTAVVAANPAASESFVSFFMGSFHCVYGYLAFSYQNARGDVGGITVHSPYPARQFPSKPVASHLRVGLPIHCCYGFNRFPSKRKKQRGNIF
jgi:hypothetical protein